MIRWLRTVSIVLSLVILAATGLFFVLAMRIRNLQPVAIGQLVKGFGGITTQGQTISSNEHCHLIRFATPRCKYCREDLPSWNYLAKAAALRGCSVTSVLPMYEEPMKEYPGHDQPEGDTVVFPSPSFAKDTRFRMTPTTIICDKGGQVLWIKNGIMSDADRASAVNVLQSL